MRLVFIGTANPVLNIERVAERVAAGGHHVPDADVLRRFGRAMANLPAALCLADHTWVFDNSAQTGVLALEIVGGAIIAHLPAVPAWVQNVLDRANRALDPGQEGDG